MKCPHCDYQEGWCSEVLDIVKGEHGEFFTLKLKMTRPDGYLGRERAKLVACPSCTKTFVEL